MSLEPGRAPRVSRFVTIKEALKRQARDLARARRRRVALHKEPGFRGSERAVILMLRQLLDCAEPIALNNSRGAVHLLMTVPDNLLHAAFSLAGFEEDQDTGDDEPTGNDFHSDDAEQTLAVPDGIIDQTHPAFSAWCNGEGYELDTADSEPSLGSLDGEMNQERWAAGSRLDLERAPGGGDCDDDEDSHDRENDTSDYEPEHEEPSLSSCAPGITGSIQNYGAIDGEEGGYGRDKRDDAIRSRLKAHASMPVRPPLATVESEPGMPEIFLPTGNRPGGALEMRNQTTGETGVWRRIPEAGRKAVRS